MKRKADLHTHSTASDGQYRPEELVQLAKNAGLEVIALTDHDTIDGISEAVQAGNAAGICVLPGIELSASEYRTFHILGYRVDPNVPDLQALCTRLKAGRDQRKYRIMQYLQEQGIAITLEEVEALADGGLITRPHFARVLVSRGYVNSVQEAFARYLDTDLYRQRVKRWKPDRITCLEVIHAAGGIASLAHPYQLGLSDEELEDLVAKLSDAGLDAIECYYPRYTPEQENFYLALCRKYHLQITGGSDFHGEKIKPDIGLQGKDLELDWLLKKT